MNELFHPLVSIIIPVYNGSNYVKEAIDSALAQTYENVEILVVNDGSNDDGKTEAIARSYGDKIRYFHKENGGVSSALNLGIREMKGEYFSWLSHDDKYLPDKIKNQVETLALCENKKTLALCENLQMDKNGELLSKTAKAYFPKARTFTDKEALYHLFKLGTFCGCSLLIPKTALKEAGGFDENLRYNQDGFMWAKIFLNGYALVYKQDVDCIMRIHAGQLTQRGIEIYHRDCEYMSEYLLPEIVKIDDKKRRFLYAYAKYNAVHNTPSVWKACLKIKGGLSFFARLKIRIFGFYGKLRPAVRKAYYRLFKRVKTQ